VQELLRVDQIVSVIVPRVTVAVVVLKGGSNPARDAICEGGDDRIVDVLLLRRAWVSWS
jgi:hypothetical protein